MLENYIKMAFKVLLRKKFFTAISLFGISFTILILLVATSFLEHSVNPGGPHVNDDRILIASRLMATDSLRDGQWRASPGYGFSKKFGKTLLTPEKVSIISYLDSYFTYVNGNKIELSYRSSDPEMWDIYSFNFLYGKQYSHPENNSGQRVAVVSKSAAEKYFGTADVIGESIDVAGNFFKVIGIVEDISMTSEILHSDIWIPVKSLPNLEESFFGDFNIVVLAKSPDDFLEIKNEFLVNTKLALTDPMMPSDHMMTNPLKEIKCVLEAPYQHLIDEIFGVDDEFDQNTTKSEFITEDSFSNDFFLAISVMGIVMLLFMILPSINLININLSRIIERHSEIGVRKAFGASSNKLIGQFITENIILTIVGGIISLILTLIVLEIINSSNMMANINLTLNLTVFIVGIIICLIFGIISGVYPAYKMSRTHPVEALRGGEK